MDRTILHCDLNSFYASVECRDDPSLKGRPVAVCGNTQERHGIVLAKTEEAKRMGVRTGQTVYEARRLCPQLIVIQPHMAKYQEASRQVRKIYDSYSDLVEPFGIDECYIDATGMEWMYNSGHALAEHLRKTVKKDTGLTISVGVSFNKVFAKLGSDMKKPDAVTEITRDNFKKTVWPLSADSMVFIGPSTMKKLLLYGIRTIGDVAAAGPDFLKELLGKSGPLLWANASGEDNDPVRPSGYCQQAKSIGHGVTCTSDLENYQEVRDTLFYLSQDVSYKLWKSGLYATGVQIDVKDNSLSVKSYQAPLEVSTQNAKTITSAACSLFKKRYNWKKPVRSVTVRVYGLTSVPTPIQTSLFSDVCQISKSDCAQQAAMAVKAKFGKWTIYPASLMDVKKLPYGGHSGSLKLKT